MKAHQESTPEFVPADQYYPLVEATQKPETYGEAIAYFEDGHDLGVHAQYLAYEGYPDVQQDIVQQEALRHVSSMATTEPSNANVTKVTTRYASHVEPSIFYWHRTQQLEAKSDELRANPTMHIRAVLRHIGSLSAKELVARAPSIITLASFADETQAFELKLELARRARILELPLIEKGAFLNPLTLDQKRAA